MSNIFNYLQFCSDFFDDWGNQNIKSDMNMPEGNVGFFFEIGTKRGYKLKIHNYILINPPLNNVFTNISFVSMN